MFWHCFKWFCLKYVQQVRNMQKITFAFQILKPRRQRDIYICGPAWEYRSYENITRIIKQRTPIFNYASFTRQLRFTTFNYTRNLMTFNLRNINFLKLCTIFIKNTKIIFRSHTRRYRENNTIILIRHPIIKVI